MSAVRAAVVRRLADGARHSGAELAAELGVSRAAVGRQVAVLRRHGWQIEGRAGTGYRLAQGGALPLEHAEVVAELARVKDRVRAVEIVDEVGSTNDHLRARAFASDGAVEVCLAESQTAGRGRRGRSWQSQRGQGIALSIGRQFSQGPAELTALGIATGLGVADVLCRHGVPGVGLKWPNDILVGGAKLGGILAEFKGEADGPTRAIVGIGLNHGAVTASGEGFDQGATSMSEQLSHPPPRDRLAGAIIASAVAALDEFAAVGFEPARQRWCAFDCLSGRPVRVLLSTGTVVYGEASGVDDDGALRVATSDGLQRFLSGEVSVRADP